MSDLILAPDKVQVCRSIKVGERRTSIRMEREFWAGLDYIRKKRGMSMEDILEQATCGDRDVNRTASIKAWVLAYFRQRNLPLH